MIPIRVSLKGFMSYRDEQELSFDGAPLWVLIGANGSGKSVIFDAITFALYGCHSRHKSVGQYQEDLINHNVDNAAVEFDFSVDGQEYRVRRTLTRGGSSTRGVFRLIAGANGSKLTDMIVGTNKDKGFKIEIEDKIIGLDYEAFTSSVMLVQGQSEKLLQEDPGGRYKILSQLIELAPYQRLHEKADERRKNHERDVKSLRQQLHGIAQVSEEDLAAARKDLDEASSEYVTAQTKADCLTQLLGQSKQWEHLVGELSEQRAESQRLSSLLARGAEIQSGVARFNQLGDGVKYLREAVEHRKQLAKIKEKIDELGNESERLREAVARAKTGQQTAEQAVERIEAEIERLQGEKENLLKRLIEINSIVSLLEQFEQAQVALAQAEEELSALPADLPQALADTEAKHRDLQQAEKAQPLVAMIFDHRAKLAAALEQHQASSAGLESKTAQLSQKQARHDDLSAKLGGAEVKANRLAHEVTRAETQYGEISDKLNHFNEAAAEAKCGLCGQDITPEHAQEERARLERQVGENRLRLASLREELGLAKDGVKHIELEIKTVDGNLAAFDLERNSLERERERAGDHITQAVEHLRDAFNKLHSDYRLRIAGEPPDGVRAWLNISYPGEEDLRALSAQVKELKPLAREIEKLKKKVEKWQQFNALRGAAAERAVELETRIEIDEARSARHERDELETRKTEIESLLKNFGEEKSGLKKQSRKAAQSLETAQSNLSNATSELATAQAMRNEVERSFDKIVDTIPADYRNRAIDISVEELRTLEIERERLALYVELAVELGQAGLTMKTVEKKISQLDTSIEKLPEGARRAPALIDEELKTVIAQRSAADERRRNEERRLAEIVQHHKQRAKSEKALLEASRNEHLYKLLANLLGREGLQLFLLREAERGIVEIANEALYGLSRGRMRLDIRKDDTYTSNQSSKALDLVVYDNDTGTSPTPIHLTSGSQRFRIAVSLALAIGRYAGRGSRQIESVIIDEGFGSLDKDGRDDMIDRLNELKQHLSRIILVSHQDEFASAFHNGYFIELMSGASRVRLQG